MKEALRLVGYLAVPNEQFVTAIPLFSSKPMQGSSEARLFRQALKGTQIERFVLVPTDAITVETFVNIKSEILRCKGDDAVFVEANAAIKPIVGSSWVDFQEKIRRELKASNHIDEVLGLELSRITGDLELERTYLRRFVRLLNYQPPSVREHWLKSGLFSKGLINFANQSIADLGGIKNLSSSTKVSNNFARQGFSSHDVRYYCTSNVLELAGLFAEEVARDPITVKMRPLPEFEKDNKSRDVLLFNLDDLLEGGPEIVEEAIVRCYRDGASLVLVCRVGELPKALSLFDEYGFITKKLDRLSDLCVLSVSGESELRSFIRKNRSAEWLEKNGCLASLKPIGEGAARERRGHRV